MAAGGSGRVVGSGLIERSASSATSNASGEAVVAALGGWSSNSSTDQVCGHRSDMCLMPVGRGLKMKNGEGLRGGVTPTSWGGAATVQLCCPALLPWSLGVEQQHRPGTCGLALSCEPGIGDVITATDPVCATAALHCPALFSWS